MTYDDTPIEQRVVSIGAIREEVEANPSLTDTQVEAIKHSSNEDIEEALAANWRSVEDLFYHVHDILQERTVNYLTDLYEERKGL